MRAHIVDKVPRGDGHGVPAAPGRHYVARGACTMGRTRISARMPSTVRRYSILTPRPSLHHRHNGVVVGHLTRHVRGQPMCGKRIGVPGSVRPHPAAQKARTPGRRALPFLCRQRMRGRQQRHQLVMINHALLEPSGKSARRKAKSQPRHRAPTGRCACNRPA